MRSSFNFVPSQGFNNPSVEIEYIDFIIISKLDIRRYK